MILARRLGAIVLALWLVGSLTACSYASVRVPPTLASANEKPFRALSGVDWLNTTDAVRRDYLARALAEYPGCPVTVASAQQAITGRYSAEPSPTETPEQLFTGSVESAGCRKQ